MIPILAIILLTVSLVSITSLIGIFSLLPKGNVIDKILFILVSFAAGSMLGAAFLDLLPEAIGGNSNQGILNYVLLDNPVLYDGEIPLLVSLPQR